MSKILDGKKLAATSAQKLARKIKHLKIKPRLVILQIGDLAESNVYIRNKVTFAEKVGAKAEHIKYPENVSEKRVIADISKWNRDRSIHGIMLQLPAPKGFKTETVLEMISPAKDVDGLTAINAKHIFDGNVHTFIPATTKGVVSILDASKISIAGKRVVMVGDSALVGRPTMLALLNRGATITVCHKKTKDLAAETRRADILVTAVGKPKLIGEKHVSKNQVLVDVGITVLKNKKIVGDVDFEKVKNKVSAITPVPGGVGPMTVASLLENLIEACILQSK